MCKGTDVQLTSERRARWVKDPQAKTSRNFHSNLASEVRDFLRRLRGCSARVAQNPAILRNSKNCPLYLFCFAAGNPEGAPIALKIAYHILKDGIVKPWRAATAMDEAASNLRQQHE